MAADIRKAKLKDGYLECEYVEENKRGDKTIKAECKAPVHPDMVEAFKQLDYHVAVLCEQIPAREHSHKLLPSITCTGFSIGGSDEHEGVTLIGSRKLKNNRVLNLVSPFTKWKDEHNGYDESYELQSAIHNCMDEVDAYLFHGKYAPDPQMELAFEDGKDSKPFIPGGFASLESKANDVNWSANAD